MVIYLLRRNRSRVGIVVYYLATHFTNYVVSFEHHIMSSLLLGVRSSRSQVQQELREREDVEKELGLVKGWIQDTRGLLLSPTADLESLLQELEVGYSVT